MTPISTIKPGKCHSVEDAIKRPSQCSDFVLRMAGRRAEAQPLAFP